MSKSSGFLKSVFLTCAIFSLISACKTESSAETYGVLANRSSTGKFVPPKDIAVANTTLAPCGGPEPTCPGDRTLGQIGCSATDGKQYFNTDRAANGCVGSAALRAQICKAGLNTNNFTAACFTLTNFANEGGTHPAGAVFSGFDSMGKPTSCRAMAPSTPCLDHISEASMFRLKCGNAGFVATYCSCDEVICSQVLK